MSSPSRLPDGGPENERALIPSSARPISAAVVLAIGCLAMAQPVLDLLARTPEFFVAKRSTSLEVAALALVATLLPGLIALAPSLLARALRPIVPLSGERMLRFLAVAVLATALGLVWSRQLAPGLWWLAPPFGLLMAIACQRLPVVQNFWKLMLVALPAVPILFLFDADLRRAVDLDQRAAAGIETSTVASTTPVFFLLLDELSLETLLTDDGALDSSHFPNLAALAEQSDWYPNALAAATKTVMALPGMLSASNAAEDGLPTYLDYPDNLFTLFGNYRIRAHEEVTQLCPPFLNQSPLEEGATTTDSEDGERIGRLHRLLLDAGVVWLHQVLPEPFSHSLPPIDQNWGSFAQPLAPRPDNAASDFIGGERAESLRDFLAVLDDRDQSLNFFHLLLPHLPWEYTAAGSLYPSALATPGLGAAGWDRNHAAISLAYLRYYEQTRFTDQLVGEFLDRIRRVGAWDRSLVVVVADHGVGFHGGEARRVSQDENIEALVRVPLFIKSPGQTSGAVKDQAFPLQRLLSEMLDRLQVDSSAYAYDLGRYRMADVDLSTLREDIGTAPRPIYRALLAAARPHSELIGQPLQALEIRPTSLQARLLDQHLYQTRPRAGRNSISLDNAFLKGEIISPNPVTDACDSEASIPFGRELAVVVDGVVVTTARGFYGCGGKRLFADWSTGGLEYFGALLEPSMLPDFAVLDVYEIVTTTDGVVLAGPLTQESTTINLRLTEATRWSSADPGIGLAAGNGNDELPAFRKSGALTGQLVQIYQRPRSLIITGFAVDTERREPAHEVHVFLNRKLIGSARPTQSRTRARRQYGDWAEQSGFRIEVLGQLDGQEGLDGLIVLTVSERGDFGLVLPLGADPAQPGGGPSLNAAASTLGDAIEATSSDETGQRFSFALPDSSWSGLSRIDLLFRSPDSGSRWYLAFRPEEQESDTGKGERRWQFEIEPERKQLIQAGDASLFWIDAARATAHPVEFSRR